jgi:hypothetical protein
LTQQEPGARRASIDARLVAAYAFAPGNFGLFKVEVGYRAAVKIRCSQSVFADPGTDQSHASAHRSLPGSGATSSNELHRSRPVLEDGANGSLSFVGDHAYIPVVARRWR